MKPVMVPMKAVMSMDIMTTSEVPRGFETLKRMAKPTVAVIIMLTVETLASGRPKMALMRRTARMPTTMVTAAEREFSMTFARNLPFGLV